MKAIASRAGKLEDPRTLDEITSFASAIRGRPRKEVIASTTVIDVDDTRPAPHYGLGALTRPNSALISAWQSPDGGGTLFQLAQLSGSMAAFESHTPR